MSRLERLLGKPTTADELLRGLIRRGRDGFVALACCSNGSPS